MRAAGNGRGDNVKLLINNSADKSLKNKDGKTALDLAKENKFNDTVDILKGQNTGT